MKKLIVNHNQTLLDLVIQGYGSVDAIQDVLLQNKLGVTDALVPGTVLQIDPEPNQVVVYLTKEAVIPATLQDNETDNLPIVVANISVTEVINNEVVVLKHQSVLDVALQENGTFKALENLLIHNAISVTTLIQPGTVLKADKTITEKNILNYYKTNNIRPATNTTELYSIQTLFANGLFANGLFN